MYFFPSDQEAQSQDYQKDSNVLVMVPECFQSNTGLVIIIVGEVRPTLHLELTTCLRSGLIR
jgi:hypothetical protein